MTAERGHGAEPDGTELERESLLARGRSAFASRAWKDALAALAAADRGAPLDADDLWTFAWSCGLAGREDAMLGVLERLYELHLASGECERAAHAAFWLGFRLLFLGEVARGGGWLARAERMVEKSGRECAMQGYLLLPLVRRHFTAGEYDMAHALAERAAVIGERFGDVDLSVFARNLQGRVLLRQGRVDAGLAFIDEAMLSVTNPVLSPLVAGLVYCSALDSCQGVYALDRAREWTHALSRFCNDQPQLVTFTGACLVHRSELLELTGDWPAALSEADEAVTRFVDGYDRGVAADALYQRAELQRLRGELGRSEDDFRRASEFGKDPQPGLALLRLAQGKLEAAEGAIRRALSATTDPLRRARLLPARVEIALAANDVAEARKASDELSAIASSVGVEALSALAANTRGLVELAEGEPEKAQITLREAFLAWQRLGAPYLAARARAALGCACRELSDEEGAKLELGAARVTFDRLGAAGDLAALDRLSPPSVARPAFGLSPRELEVLRLVASGKTNKAIAKELCLSEKTIDRHVSNIFDKLDVPSRAAATAYAYEHGLL